LKAFLAFDHCGLYAE